MRACCVFLLVLCVSAQAEIKHFYRMNHDIYRGTQPKKEDFATLAHMGIRTVLDLRGGPIHKPRERKRVEAAGMRYISIRLSGIFPPKDWQVAQVLSVLEDPEKAPIFIHCWRGDDRVGLVIACYRMDHDHWTNAQALEEPATSGSTRWKFYWADTYGSLIRVGYGSDTGNILRHSLKGRITIGRQRPARQDRRAGHLPGYNRINEDPSIPGPGGCL